MTGMEIAALISAVGNVILGLWGLRKKQSLDAVAEGMVIMESAVDQQKALIEKSRTGRKVTAYVKEYGPAATAAVDAARAIANEVTKARYVRSIEQMEESKRAGREAELTAAE